MARQTKLVALKLGKKSVKLLLLQYFKIIILGSQDHNRIKILQQLQVGTAPVQHVIVVVVDKCEALVMPWIVVGLFAQRHLIISLS